MLEKEDKEHGMGTLILKSLIWELEVLGPLIFPPPELSYQVTHEGREMEVRVNCALIPTSHLTLTCLMPNVLSEKVKVLVAQSCPNLCDPIDYSSPGSSVHGILQTRILEWVAIPFSRGYSQPRDWTRVSCIAGRLFTLWATREALQLHSTSFLYDVI